MRITIDPTSETLRKFLPDIAGDEWYHKEQVNKFGHRVYRRGYLEGMTWGVVGGTVMSIAITTLFYLVR